MRLFIFIVLSAPLSWATYTLPPSSKCQSDPGFTGGASINCTVSSTTNHLITAVVFIGQDSSGTITAADTCSSTWNTVDTVGSLSTTSFNASGTIASFYAVSACTNANNVVTISWTGSTTFNWLGVTDLPGNALSMVLDDHHTNTGNSAAPSTANLVTSVSGDLLVGYCTSNGGGVPTAGSGYTAEESGTNNASMYEDQVAGAASSYTAACVQTAAGWAMLSMAFKPLPAATVSGSTIGGGSTFKGANRIQ